MLHTTKRLLQFAILMMVACKGGAVVLSTTYIGEGAVNPPVGSSNYRWGSQVVLTATAASGWSFDHWEGQGALYSEANPLPLRMRQPLRVTAVFQPVQELPENQLARYVGRYDPAYEWAEYDTDIHFGWTKHTVQLSSQEWRDRTEVDRPLWEHGLGIIEPWFSDNQAILFINGGSNDDDPPQEVADDIALVAFLIGVKYVQLDQVPNEPLTFTDESKPRSEDEILAYSLDKAINTEDMEWPVHLAMTKSAVRAMDVVQELLPGIDKFAVAGGSKRGWTAYLTAAVDPRVRVLVPASIDIANVREITFHHFAVYGCYTPAVQDYVNFDLFCRLDEPAVDSIEHAVATIVDPLTYVEKYTMPKFLANSAGDEFFPPDSSRFYWSELPDKKWMRYTVNTSHSQEQDPTAITAPLFAADRMLDGKPLPLIAWKVGEPELGGDDYLLTVQSDTAPLAVTLWQAHNPKARDFRLEEIGPVWTSTQLSDQGGNLYEASVPLPDMGWTAFLVELRYGDGIILSTQPTVIPDIRPYEDDVCKNGPPREICPSPQEP